VGEMNWQMNATVCGGRSGPEGREASRECGYF
jgi:hypothetical protein